MSLTNNDLLAVKNRQADLLAHEPLQYSRFLPHSRHHASMPVERSSRNYSGQRQNSTHFNGPKAMPSVKKGVSEPTEMSPRALSQHRMECYTMLNNYLSTVAP